jgi:hypothetical protein
MCLFPSCSRFNLWSVLIYLHPKLLSLLQITLSQVSNILLGYFISKYFLYKSIKNRDSFFNTVILHLKFNNMFDYGYLINVQIHVFLIFLSNLFISVFK